MAETKKAFVETFGCQMNEHDSHRMIELLDKEGYLLTQTKEEADVIIINTCSVRESPENKVYSFLGRIRTLKEKNKNLIIGVGGCVAQQEGNNILRREKAVDLVFGTDNYMQLPDMLKEVKNNKRILNTKRLPHTHKIQNFIPQDSSFSHHINGCKSYVTITKGCDNFCSFCIVPMTRGREVSRVPEDILLECQQLIKRGAREITLLGQNVNSYRANNTGFLDLLKQVAKLDNLYRIRFVSPHPKDWNNELSDFMAENKVLCNQLHLPFQAGSSRVVKLMRRGHTTEQYVTKMKYLQQKIPNVALSTDIIVGFPTETNEEFQKTLQVMKEIKFHQVYAFKYSPRPGTRASKMKNDVPHELKQGRLQQVLQLHEEIRNQHFQNNLGSIKKILIDSQHPKDDDTLQGRTEENIAVSLIKCKENIGDLVNAKIIGKKRFSLIGEVI